MDAPTPDDVRRALAELDPRKQKIVVGMLTVMIQDPGRVREREWIAERLTELTLLAIEVDADTPDVAVRAVQEYLEANVDELVRASYLLFERVGLDLAPRAAEGFTFEDALGRGLGYLPHSGDDAEKGEDSDHDPLTRDLGEQPLARSMAERGLKPSDLVAASTEQITHKMVTRAMKGRRLTANTMDKVQRAWEHAAGEPCRRTDLFNYKP